jgi:hypothetical protein
MSDARHEQKYRLRNGDVGTYEQSLVELISIWQEKANAAQERVYHFTTELIAERARQEQAPTSTGAELCCASPNINIKWLLGRNDEELFFFVDAITCNVCGSPYFFDNEKSCPNRGIVNAGRGITLAVKFNRRKPS